MFVKQMPCIAAQSVTSVWQEGQDKPGGKAVPERPQTRTESGHLPDLSGAPRVWARVQGESVLNLRDS